MKCPLCHVDLERTEYEGASVFQCKSCSGYMVDRQRITLIKMSRGKSPQQLQAEAKARPQRDQNELVRCPRCHSKMQVKRVNANLETRDYLLLDQCDLCHAIWFDPGELAKMQMDFERSSQAIEHFKQQALAAGRTDEERAEAQKTIDNLPEDLVATSVMTDMMLLVSFILLGGLTLFFKLSALPLLAAVAFGLITAIAICAALRYLDETRTERVVAAGIGIIGLILSFLIWYW